MQWRYVVSLWEAAARQLALTESARLPIPPIHPLFGGMTSRSVVSCSEALLSL